MPGGPVDGVATTSALERLCAHPVKKRGRGREGGQVHERVRGVGKALAPFGLGIYRKRGADGQPQEVGGLIVLQTPLIRGQGRLVMTALAEVGAKAALSLRVAYSVAMLLERGLEQALGPGSLRVRLRSQEYDMQTFMMTCGLRLKGNSLGVVAFLGMVQAMTECAFFDKMSSTGALSLMGHVWKVDGIAQKVDGALEAGQRAVLLPSANQPDVLALPGEGRAALDFHLVSNVAEVLRGAVVGWQRRMSLPLPTLDVASMVLPMTLEGRDWVMVVDAAVVPGHGEVHITGTGDISVELSEAIRAAVFWARTYQEHIVELLQIVVPQSGAGPVQQVVDLARMRYTEQHPWAGEAFRPGAGGGMMVIPDNSLDLHIHLPTVSTMEVERAWILGGAVLLGSLLTGVPLPQSRKVTVIGVCEHSGLAGMIYSDSTQRLWEVAERLGVDKMILNYEDYDRSMDPERGGPVDMARVPTVRVETMMQALREVWTS